MMRAFSFAAALGGILLAAALTLTGCGVQPPSPPALSPVYNTSRDGYLYYRLPSGWFDVTADSQAHGNAIWLLRNDYAATITVNEIQIDASAREEIARNGMIPLAQLTMSLSERERKAVLQRFPEEFVMKGQRCCLYELAMPSTGDLLRVVLLSAGKRVYAVAALTEGKASGEGDVAVVQMKFVEELRW